MPKSGVYIETDPSAEKEPMQRSTDDSKEVEDLWKQLMRLKQELPPNFELHPITFEKDDDENYHMDAIAGLANMRARNYRYGRESRSNLFF